MPNEINLKIVLQNPLAGTIYGLQKGKGPNYETIQAQLGDGKDLYFEFVVQVKQTKGSVFSFSGPHVQGTPVNRFVYINIGSYAGQAGAKWSGRMKIPLPANALLDEQFNTDTLRWYCTVPGRTKEGKPMFATVKSFGGWVRQEPSV